VRSPSERWRNRNDLDIGDWLAIGDDCTGFGRREDEKCEDQAQHGSKDKLELPAIGFV